MSGAKANDVVVSMGGGSYQVTDTRVGAPDGVDVFSGIGTIQSSNGYTKLKAVVA